MTDPSDSTLRNVSDTALWVAMYRARETERSEALFRDPLARRLAGDRGERIAARLAPKARDDWPFVTRTFLFDQLIIDQIDSGIDTVVNLAAGLDARPYRMNVPGSLRWVEVDLPELIRYKEEVLDGVSPRCRLERVALDLSNRPARQAFFDRFAGSGERVLIVSEGLLVYLPRQEVAELATDLRAVESFDAWALDLASPRLLDMLRKRWGEQLGGAEAPLVFAPEEGPRFFTVYGWKPADVQSVLKAAGRLGRLHFPLNLFAKLPEPREIKGNMMWSGVCLYFPA